jgi:hypothetical protein
MEVVEMTEKEGKSPNTVPYSIWDTRISGEQRKLSSKIQKNAGSPGEERMK